MCSRWLRFAMVVSILCSGMVLACQAPERRKAIATPTPTLAPTAVRTLTPTPTPTAVRTPSPEHPTEELLAWLEMPERDLLDIATRLKHPEESIPTVVNPVPPRYEVGDNETFWVWDEVEKTHFTATATLCYITPHLYVWVEDGYEVDQKALEKSAERFEDRIYPTNRRFFGEEWAPGVDNDPHIHIFNGHVPGLGGYYSSSDEYSHLIHLYSNEREIVYINLDALQPGTEAYEGVLAHEFQHMIHWAVDRNEDTWVNEGFSELATQLNGYSVGGASYVFSRSPDVQLTSWPEPEEATPNYGASYLFMAYFLERFDEELTRQVVNHQANGIAAFNAVLAERGLTFEDVFADWLVANYLDDPQLADGRYDYQSLNQATPKLDQTHDHYPVRRSTTVHQYGADYIEIKGDGDVAIEFDGAEQVKLIPNEPHSGRYQWWGGRGDQGDSRLTRAFDLSGIERATLEVWLWYDIEEDWDYAYIEVSTDGGETWEVLKGKYATDTNPHGNSFGHAYTGKSGFGNRDSESEGPAWVKEEIDLTPYVGREILLRFEYITDDAVNRVGFCVDDVSIPEVGYTYDAEDDDHWVAEGFIRTDNMLSQRFLVQLIEVGAETRVRLMKLDEAQNGRLVVKGLGEGVERAVLVVSGLAPLTTELASYEYSIKLSSSAKELLPLAGRVVRLLGYDLNGLVGG